MNRLSWFTRVGLGLTTLLGICALIMACFPEAVSEAAAATDVVSHGGKELGAAHLENSALAGVLFWVFALATVGGSVFVLTRSNMISAVMGLVGTFFAIAAVYTMLYAHFLAVIQVMVYAGAIMVLFVFVIMILNRPIDDPWSRQGLFVNGLACLATVYLAVRLGSVLWSVEPTNPAKNLAPGATVGGFDFGSTRSIGDALFGQYLFPFEAVSVVLLIAVVGAIAVARPNAMRETNTTVDDGGAAGAAE